MGAPVTPRPLMGEGQAWVACRTDGFTAIPLATIWAATFSEALTLAEAMHGADGSVILVGRKTTFPNLWETAFDREARAEHASRGESRASRAVHKAMAIIKRIGLP